MLRFHLGIPYDCKTNIRGCATVRGGQYFFVLVFTYELVCGSVCPCVGVFVCPVYLSCVWVGGVYVGVVCG